MGSKKSASNLRKKMRLFSKNLHEKARVLVSLLVSKFNHRKFPVYWLQYIKVSSDHGILALGYVYVSLIIESFRSADKYLHGILTFKWD
jgi:hypothetical protein